MPDQKVILSTTYSVEGYRIVRYLDMEMAYVDYLGIKKQAKALNVDFKREQVIVAFEILREKMKKIAQEKGCNGVLGVQFKALPIGHRRDPSEGRYAMYGTLVKLEKD